MTEKKTYNHAMDIAFAVPDSEYEDWFVCLKHEKQAVINALQKRVREVFETNEYAEAITGFDTYEE
jgi:glutamate-1-semialdehyde aminotransferase